MTFLLPKPRANEREEKKEKAAVNAAKQTAGEDAEMDSDAAETATKAAVVAAASTAVRSRQAHTPTLTTRSSSHSWESGNNSVPSNRKIRLHTAH